MYYEAFQKLCEERNVKPAQVARETHISTATLSSWKQNRYTPKADKIQRIADYFGVSVDYFTAGKEEPQTKDEPGFHVRAISLFSGSAAKDMLIRTMEKALREMFSDTEFNLIALFRQLNPEGQNKLLEYLMDLLDMPKYTAQTDADK